MLSHGRSGERGPVSQSNQKVKGDLNPGPTREFEERMFIRGKRRVKGVKARAGNTFSPSLALLTVCRLCVPILDRPSCHLPLRDTSSSSSPHKITEKKIVWPTSHARRSPMLPRSGEFIPFPSHTANC